MNDALRLGAILAASFIALHAVQRLFDRRAARRLDAAAARHGLAPRPLPGVEELRGELPFLADLEGAEPVAIRSGSIGGGDAHLIAIGTRAGGGLGYTLLARRVPRWSARAIIRPDSVAAGPAAGGPDPRRVAALARPELLAALERAGAWLHAEGPWRVVGAPGRPDPAMVERLAELSRSLGALAPEPDESGEGAEGDV